ncbi:MAG: ribosome biogenesis GTPase Der [Deltaproteobacteria bacterium]|nr:ribosome biogenesis GTPase Der [Deltaproteobacteria bacterium]
MGGRGTAGRRGTTHGGIPIEGGRGERLPFVAIVGRPNAGKSTLFNRLARAPLSIVDPTPGVTRDRLYAEVELRGRPVGLIDTGGIEAEGTSGDKMSDHIRLQVRVALEETDLVVCLFDASTPPGGDDARVVDLLRRAGRPVIWAANKVDRPADEPGAAEYYALGISELRMVSAASGLGVGALLDAILAALPPEPPRAEVDGAPGDDGAEPGEDDVSGEERRVKNEERPVPRVAVIGRPNAGKSTLVNRLLGAERMLVDERPGTTRDAVDAAVETAEGPMVLIDTAGLRRRARIADRLERLSGLSAVRALERCHVAVLLVDGAADAGTDQDQHLLGLAAERGRGLIVAVNKLDLVTGSAAQRELDGRLRDAFGFAAYAPILFVSARSGRGVRELVRTIARTSEAFNRRVGTGELNRFLADAVTKHSPPLFHNRPVRLLYGAQTGVRPPTFVFMCNRPEGVHPSYERYLENRLRERYGFDGCPIKLRFRRARRDESAR